MAARLLEGYPARPDPQLTIVVPFWNVRSGGLLQASVRDALRSRIEEVSVIVVDDHSDAPSASALSSALSDESNVRIVKTPRNCGPGFARNAGLDLVETDWVVFADADDDMDVDAYLELVRAGFDGQVDVVAGSYGVSLNDAGRQSRTGFKDLPSDRLTESLFRRAAVWRFAFRTEYLREQRLRFPELRYAEDLLFMLKLASTRPRYRAVESATVTVYRAPASPPTPSGTDFQDLLGQLSNLYRDTSDTRLQRLINAWRIRLAAYQELHTSNRSPSGRRILASLAPRSPRELGSLMGAFGRVVSDLLRNPTLLGRNRTPR